MSDDILCGLKQFMFYDRPPQLNVPVEHREKEGVSLSILKPPPPMSKPVQSKPVQSKDIVNKVFTPYQKDTLFWCFYKIVHEELTENINIAMEKTLKIKYVEQMRKQKELIKKYKFASISHIENQLANEEVIDITVFFVLSLIHKLNVVYVKNKTYYELIVNEDSDSSIYIVYFLEHSKFGYSTTKDKSVYNLFYKIDNLNKPIKAVSSYKVSELIELCNKLSIPIEKLKNKKQYYEAIVKSL